MLKQQPRQGGTNDSQFAYVRISFSGSEVRRDERVATGPSSIHHITQHLAFIPYRAVPPIAKSVPSFRPFPCTVFASSFYRAQRSRAPCSPAISCSRYRLMQPDLAHDISSLVYILEHVVLVILHPVSELASQASQVTLLGLP
jgi:hypothetical protein